MGQQIKFNYKCADDYRPVYVNGVYGGINAAGDLIANFFAELPIIVKEEIFNISLEGNFEAEEKLTQPEELIQVDRLIQAGIAMNVETAKVLRDWIDKYIKTAETQTMK